MRLAVLKLLVCIFVLAAVAQMVAQRFLRPRLRALDRVICRTRVSDKIHRQLAPADQLVDVRVIRCLRRPPRIHRALCLERDAQRADMPEVQIGRELTRPVDLWLAPSCLVAGKLVLDEVPQPLLRRMCASTERIHWLHASIEVPPTFSYIVVEHPPRNPGM